VSKTLKVEIAGICLKINVERDKLFEYLKTFFRKYLSRRSPDYIVDILSSSSPGERIRDIRAGQMPPASIVRKGKKLILQVNLSSRGSKRNVLEAGFIDMKEKRAMLNDYLPGLTKLLSVPFLRSFLHVILSEKGGFLLHASGVVNNGHCCLFSGPSGSGKTTIANLSKGMKILSDDIVCVKKAKGGYFASSTPWRKDEAGKPVRVGGIFFIRHGKKTVLKKMTTAIASLEITKNMFNACSDEKVLAKMLNTAKDISSIVDCYEMRVSLKEPFWEKVKAVTGKSY